jgi:hypothetical protein
LLYEENFAVPPFTVGNGISGINSWAAHSGAASNIFTCAASGLTYPGYLSSNVGYAAQTGIASGEDINKPFTSQTSGSVYASFMINFSSCLSNTQDYAVHFGITGMTTQFYGRLYVQKNASNKLRFGISKISTNTNNIAFTGGTWASGTYDYDINTTYLIIMKYTIVSSTANDEVRLWINPTLGTTEPTPTLMIGPLSTPADAGTDPGDIATFALRQSGNTPLGRYDGIRIGTSWADVGTPAFTGSIETYGTTSLTFTTGNGTHSAVQTYDLEGINISSDISITAPAHFELSCDDSPAWESTKTLTSTLKTISVRYSPVTPGVETGNILHVAGNAADVNIAVSGTSTSPMSIGVDPSTLTFSSVVGVPSAYQPYTLTGSNLTESIVVTAPTGYTVCATSGGTYQSSITVASNYNAPIYVKFTPTALGANNGVISNVANSITTNVNVNGTGTVAPLNISVGTTVSQNFDGIGVSATAAVPENWKVDKQTTAILVGNYATAVSATERIGGDAMSTTAGNGIYNYGAGDPAAATDRCIGFLSATSTTKSGNLYVKLTNNGSSTITALGVAYNVEKYRKGSNPQGFSVQMYTSPDGTTWTSAGVGYLTSWTPDADNTGYTPTPGDTKAVNANISVSVPAAGVIYLAWNYSCTSGTTTSNAQGLGIDDISITGKDVTFVEVPSFGLPAGIYYTVPQSVTLSCATPSAEIHYTTNGDIPTAASNLYTGAIPVSETTTIKAIGVKAGSENSGVNTAIYRIPVDCANIAALRTKTADNFQPYKLTGEAILTLQSTVTASKNKYIQDASGAIQIYDPTPYKMTTAYVLGDGITGLYGTLTTYGNMLEFVPLLDAGAATHTSGYVPVPVDVTLAAFNTSYQAKLVHIKNVTINPATPTPFPSTAGQNYTITDPTGPGILRSAYTDLDYIGTAVPTTAKDYTGVCLQYLTDIQLVPRSLADIVDAFLGPISVAVTVSGNDIHLDWPAVSGATSYIIQWSDIPGSFSSAQQYTSGTNSKIITGEALNYPHRFYQVIAVK